MQCQFLQKLEYNYSVIMKLTSPINWIVFDTKINTFWFMVAVKSQKDYVEYTDFGRLTQNSSHSYIISRYKNRKITERH